MLLLGLSMAALAAPHALTARSIAGWDVSDGTDRLEVDRGTRDGVVHTQAALRVFRVGNDSQPVEIGTARVEEVGKKTTIVRVYLAEGDDSQIGDYVDLLTERVPPEGSEFAWELAAAQVELRVGDGEVLNDWAEYRKGRGPTDAEVCDAVAAAIRVESGPFFAQYPEMDVVFEAGRWSGRRWSEALGAFTADEACQGLAYLLDLQRSIFVDDSQTAFSIVGAWAMAGGYMPEREMRRRVATASDAELADLLARHRTDDTYEQDWMAQLRRFGEVGNREEVEALVPVMERFAAATGQTEDQGRARWARGWLRYLQGDGPGALADFDEAIGLLPYRKPILLADRAYVLRQTGDRPAALEGFAAAAAEGDIADRWEYYGDALVDASRYDEALAAYEKCIGYHDAQRSNQQSARDRNWCRLGVATAMNWQNRHEEALPIWEEVERDARLYGQDRVLAGALHGRAIVLSRIGRTRDADDLGIAAANLYAQLGDATMAATAERDVAIWYVALGYPVFAREKLQWAIDQLRPTNDRISLGLTLAELARVEWFAGDQASSLALLDEAEDLADGSPALRAYVLGTRGDQLREATRDAEADAAYTAVIDSGPDKVYSIRSRIGRGLLRSDRADLEAAAALAHAAPDPTNEASAILAMGTLALQAGDLQAALAEYERAEVIARGAHANYELAEALRRKGIALMDLGRVVDAKPFVSEAFDLQEEVLEEPYGLHEAFLAVETAGFLLYGDSKGTQDFVDEHLKRVTSQEILADQVGEARRMQALLLLRRGDLGRAAATADQARREATRADDRATEAGARTILAEVHLLRGDAAAAVGEAERAVAVARTQRIPGDALVDALERLAVSRLAARDPDGAMTAAEAALTEVPESFRGRVLARVVRGHVLGLRGDASGALAELQAAVDTEGRRVDPSHRDRARIALAGQLVAMGDLAGAERVLGTLERLPEQDRPLAADADRARGLLLLARGDSAGQRLVASADERVRAYARGESEGTEVWRGALLALEAAAPDLTTRAAVAPRDLEGLQRDLRPGEAIVLPVVLSDRIVLFVAKGGAAEPLWREVPVGEAQVNGLVAEMRDALQTPYDPWQPSRGAKVVVGARKDPTAPSRSLHELLIAPIAADLEGVETVIFAPEGRLRYVPFAALYDGERYLVERFAVSLLTASGSTTTTHRPVDRAAKLLTLSNPDGSLPGASAEAAAIGRTWGRRHTIAHDGEAATEDQLRADLGGVRMLHLATHGVLRGDAPRESYLLFAGGSQLTVREITLLRLDDIDLAVLSACETAVGDGGEGREIAGLAYQLEVRGAAAVVASLWAVNDEGTSRLMSDLYGNLSRREPRADALREAQLAMLRDPDLRHPYFWAPFVLIGDWR